MANNGLAANADFMPRSTDDYTMREDADSRDPLFPYDPGRKEAEGFDYFLRTVKANAKKLGASLLGDDDAVMDAYYIPNNLRREGVIQDDATEDVMRHLLLGALTKSKLGKKYIDDREIEAIEDSGISPRLREESRIDLNNNRYGALLGQKYTDKNELIEQIARVALATAAGEEVEQLDGYSPLMSTSGRLGFNKSGQPQKGLKPYTDEDGVRVIPSEDTRDIPELESIDDYNPKMQTGGMMTPMTDATSAPQGGGPKAAQPDIVEPELDMPVQAVPKAIATPLDPRDVAAKEVRDKMAGVPRARKGIAVTIGMGSPEEDKDYEEASEGNPPPGATKEEVADDQHILASKGELVVAANVVRWNGLAAYEQMRQDALRGLSNMEDSGQIQYVEDKKGGSKTEKNGLLTAQQGVIPVPDTSGVFASNVGAYKDVQDENVEDAESPVVAPKVEAPEVETGSDKSKTSGLGSPFKSPTAFESQQGRPMTVEDLADASSGFSTPTSAMVASAEKLGMSPQEYAALSPMERIKLIPREVGYMGNALLGRKPEPTGFEDVVDSKTLKERMDEQKTRSAEELKKLNMLKYGGEKVGKEYEKKYGDDADIKQASDAVMGKDIYGRYIDPQKEHRRLGVGLSEGEKLSEMVKQNKVNYVLNQAKNFGVSEKDITPYIDAQGNFKPTDDAPQKIKDLQTTGVSSTGIKVKGYSAPPGEKDPIIGSANKIICTAMHDMAGFGSYRNTIWQNYAKNAYKNDNVQLGYHKVFANLTKKMYNSPRLSKFLGYFARNRTAYIRNKMRNKPNSLGSIVLWNTIESGLYLLGAAISRGWIKKREL
jgi:hypothetical protein